MVEGKEKNASCRKEVNVCIDTCPRHMRENIFLFFSTFLFLQSSKCCGVATTVWARRIHSQTSKRSLQTLHISGLHAGTCCMLSQMQARTRTQGRSHRGWVCVREADKKVAGETEKPRSLCLMPRSLVHTSLGGILLSESLVAQTWSEWNQNCILLEFPT